MKPASPSLRDVMPGAEVAHEGALFGSIEEVLTNPATGEPEAVLVRHGRADYLLRVPAQYVRAESQGGRPGRLQRRYARFVRRPRHRLNQDDHSKPKEEERGERCA